MNGQMIAFISANGLLFAAVAALIVLLIKKHSDVLMEAMFGAVLCFLTRYILYPIAFGAFMGLADSAGGAATSIYLHTLIEIAFAALFETLCLLIAFLLFRKRVRFDTALAFAVGYWLFTAVLTLAVNVFDALTSASLVFTGSELAVFTSGIQILIELPFYCFLAVLTARTVAEGGVQWLLCAIGIDLMWRVIAALPAVINFAMLISLGLMLLLALMAAVMTIRARRAMEDYRAAKEEAERELEALLAAAEAEAAAGDAEADEAPEDEGIVLVAETILGESAPEDEGNRDASDPGAVYDSENATDAEAGSGVEDH